MDPAREWLPVVVNGETRAIPSESTVQTLLEQLSLADRRVAVALNREVVPRSRYAQTRLAAGDHVEILEAVGGG